MALVSRAKPIMAVKGKLISATLVNFTNIWQMAALLAPDS